MPDPEQEPRQPLQQQSGETVYGFGEVAPDQQTDLPQPEPEAAVAPPAEPPAPSEGPAGPPSFEVVNNANDKPAGTLDPEGFGVDASNTLVEPAAVRPEQPDLRTGETMSQEQAAAEDAQRQDMNDQLSAAAHTSETPVPEGITVNGPDGPRFMDAFDGYRQRVDTGGHRSSPDGGTFTRRDGTRDEERHDTNAKIEADALRVEAKKLRDEAETVDGRFSKDVKLARADGLEKQADELEAAAESSSSEGFPMAVNVVPEEEVERVPGINASEGDPDHINEAEAVPDIATAHAQAKEEDFRRSEARINRELAQEDKDEPGGGEHWADNARWQDERAGQEGFWAGILHNHPLPEGYEKYSYIFLRGERVEKLTPETLVELEDYAKELQSLLDDVKNGNISMPNYVKDQKELAGEVSLPEPDPLAPLEHRDEANPV